MFRVSYDGEGHPVATVSARPDVVRQTGQVVREHLVNALLGPFKVIPGGVEKG